MGEEQPRLIWSSTWEIKEGDREPIWCNGCSEECPAEDVEWVDSRFLCLKCRTQDDREPYVAALLAIAAELKAIRVLLEQKETGDGS